MRKKSGFRATNPVQDGVVFRRAFFKTDTTAVGSLVGIDNAFGLGARSWFNENQAAFRILEIDDVFCGSQGGVKKGVRSVAMHAGLAIFPTSGEDGFDVAAEVIIIRAGRSGAGAGSAAGSGGRF